MLKYGWLVGTMVILMAACGGSQQPEAGLVNSKETCEAAGGRVATDPGNGSVSCGPEEEAIGKLSGTIEGALCCHAKKQGTAQ